MLIGFQNFSAFLDNKLMCLKLTWTVKVITGLLF